TDAGEGVMATDTRVCIVTVRFTAVLATVLLPMTSVAATPVLPTPAPVAGPFEAGSLETLTMVGMAADHVAVSVRSWVVVSLKNPVALNWMVVPLAIEPAG